MQKNKKPNKVRELRNKLRLTQIEFCSRLNCSLSTLQKLERCKYNVGLQLKRKLLNDYHLDIFEVIK